MHESQTSARPRGGGRVALTVVFTLLALNAWLQVLLVPLGRSDDPVALIVLQTLVGAAALLAAIGSWTGARWAPAASLSYGVIGGFMVAMLGPILDLGAEAQSGLLLGAVVVLLFGIAMAWYLRRALARPEPPRP